MSTKEETSAHSTYCNCKPYYTKSEIDSQNQLLFDIIKKLKGGKQAISDTLEFRKAFPFLF